MSNIIIKNLRYGLPTQPWQVRVDRASKLGNPYPINKTTSRDKACDLYEDYLVGILNNEKEDHPVKLAFYKLIDLYDLYGKLELFCWCTPMRCHAESIKRLIEHRVSK